jgi:FG-GAP repeat
VFVPPPLAAKGIVAADFNQDGIVDLAVGSPFSTLTGNRFGEYFGTEFDTPGDIGSMAVGDFNLDGKPDVVAIYTDQGFYSVFLNTSE